GGSEEYRAQEADERHERRDAAHLDAVHTAGLEPSRKVRDVRAYRRERDEVIGAKREPGTHRADLCRSAPDEYGEEDLNHAGDRNGPDRRAEVFDTREVDRKVE